jgi:hypothetical protein
MIVDGIVAEYGHEGVVGPPPDILQDVHVAVFGEAVYIERLELRHASLKPRNC